MAFFDVEQDCFVYASFGLPIDRIGNTLFDCGDLNDTRQKKVFTLLNGYKFARVVGCFTQYTVATPNEPFENKKTIKLD